MKKLFKRLLILLAIVLAIPVVLWFAGYLLPAEVVLETQRKVPVPPEPLYELFTTYDGHVKWWRAAGQQTGDELHVKHLSGPLAGPGLVTGYQSSTGTLLESWLIIEVSEPRRVRMKVDFQIFEADRTLTLIPEGSGTLINWHERARVQAPHWRWMLLISKAGAIENRLTVLKVAGDLVREELAVKIAPGDA